MNEPFQIHPEENPQLLKEDYITPEAPPTPSSSSTIMSSVTTKKVSSSTPSSTPQIKTAAPRYSNFNEFVLSFKNNLQSADLERHLLSISNEQFQQLEGTTCKLHFY
jgi:hypothetical protein